MSSLQDQGTIPKRLRWLSEHYPDRELFVFYRGYKRDAYTSTDIFQLAGKFANILREQGFGRYDVIANTLPNSPERLITDIGIKMAGCVAMNGQILLADGSDFLRSAQVSRCSAVVLCPEDDQPAWRLLKSYVSGDTSRLFADMSCDRSPDMKTAICVSRKGGRSGKSFMDELREDKRDSYLEETSGPDDNVMVFTTSGSTGYSKLVPRSHREIIDGWGLLSGPFTDISDEAVMYNDRPLGWQGGFPFATYYKGDRRALSDQFDATEDGDTIKYIWNIIRQERCKSAFILPLELDQLVRYVESIGGPDHRLASILSGGQPLKMSTVKQALTISDSILVAYAATENLVLTAGVVKDESEYKDFLCGKPLKDVTVKVLDDDGTPCGPGQVGMVHAKSPLIFRGFFNRLEDPDPNTAKSFTSDGWFRTEDNGYLDEDGNLYVIGREKDIITYGAVVLYPGWLEQEIGKHPDVVEAFVAPVSDPIIYQNICAIVKPVAGSGLNEETLRDFCKKNIFISQGEQTPMPKFFMILKDFPQTVSGKQDKPKMKQMAEELFGRKE